MPIHITKEYEFEDRTKQLAVHTSYHTHASPHAHNFFEILYVVSGKIHHNCNGKKHDLLPGDFFFIDLPDIHGYTTSIYDDNPPCIMNLMFSPAIIDNSIKHCKNFTELLNNQKLEFLNKNYIFQIPQTPMHDTNGEILALIKQLQNETISPDPLSDLIIYYKLIALILSILRSDYTGQTITKRNSITTKILKMVSERYFEDNLLVSACNELNYSLPHLSNTFKKDMGISFKDYLQSIRIQEAESLLIHSNQKISEISKQVGYTDTKYFYNLFKKYTRMTPTQYRNLGSNAENLSL